MSPRRIREGGAEALGAIWTGNGTNFTVFSTSATKVEICLFDSAGGSELERLALPEYTDGYWHGFIPEVGPGSVYGLRVHGPYDPANGYRFNPNKLLLDPCARGHVGELKWSPECFGYTLGAEGDDLTFDERDSAAFVPKCVVVDPRFDWNGKPRSRRVPWDRTIIYEAHVRGFTRLHPAVPEHERGTFRGMASPEVIGYLKSLGVTSIELLPVQTFVNENELLERGLTNYWGYNSIGFFAPDPRYASAPDQTLREFKEMVARYHEAGFEVILDVVYNHTAEGNERGPTLSFRGIDNAVYYRLLADNHRYYINDTGAGNTLNLSHPPVIQMVMDSLRYWVNELHVDGFRFDLGTVLARELHGFDNQSGFLRAVNQDPVLRTVKLIAEPWDCGPGGYQVGAFPPGWSEWNDRFRDVIRDFWKGNACAREVAPRLTASGDLFNSFGRRPSASINFITSHDGFTLRDLVSYNDKHNQANGEDNQDDTNDNRSWNCGADGETDDADVIALRDRQMRNFLATLLLSQGTPMITAGDEAQRTQQGNNNAYCQDNDTSWVRWDIDDRGLTSFVRRLIELRSRHSILRRNRFLSGDFDEELQVRDLTWINASGDEMREEDWRDDRMQCFGMLMDGRARPTGLPQLGHQATLLLVLNGYHDLVEFTLPPYGGPCHWRLLVDTNLPELASPADFVAGGTYGVTGRSLLLFEWHG